MLAGGTGITPMFQILSAALCNPVNTAHFIILSFSKSDRDICMHQDLLELQAGYPTYLTLKFLVSNMTGALDSVINGSVRTLPAQQLLPFSTLPPLYAQVPCFARLALATSLRPPLHCSDRAACPATKFLSGDENAGVWQIQGSRKSGLCRRFMHNYTAQHANRGHIRLMPVRVSSCFKSRISMLND